MVLRSFEDGAMGGTGQSEPLGVKSPTLEKRSA